MHLHINSLSITSSVAYISYINIWSILLSFIPASNKLQVLINVDLYFV